MTPIVAAAAVAACTAMFASRPASAQQPAAPQAAEPATVSDIMARQQERHIKLWFAGRGRNWELADYELDALKGGFDDVNDQLGGATVKDAVGAPLAALENAIARKDVAGFARAFDQLTAGCNSCHQTLDHAFIVIRRPSRIPYSDQFFAVPKK